MAEEAVIASRDFINEGEFLPEITSSDDVVAGLDASPELLGYVATTSKPGAATLMRIGPDRDPLLASWQAGLGRVVSWTSDASRSWSQRWAGWDGYTGFWSDVVKSTFRTDDIAGAVRARVSDGHLVIDVEGPANFPDGSIGTAIVAGPDGQRYEIDLDRSGGNSFSGDLPVTRRGSYAVGVQVADGDTTVLTTSTLASDSYPAEFAPGQSDAARLAHISELSGGRGEIEPAAAFDTDGLLAGHRRLALTGPFLLAAALAWPVAVALSRLSVRGATLSGARDGLRRTGRRVRAAVPKIGHDPDDAPSSPAPSQPAPTGTRSSSVNELLARKRDRRAGGDSGGDATPE
jgi:hypothetical protein